MRAPAVKLNNIFFSWSIQDVTVKQIRPKWERKPLNIERNENKKIETHEAEEWLTRTFRVRLIIVTKCDQMIMMYLTVWLPSRSNNLKMITNFHRINSAERSCWEYIESKSKICISIRSFVLQMISYHPIYTPARSSLYKYFSFLKFI